MAGKGGGTGGDAIDGLDGGGGARSARAARAARAGAINEYLAEQAAEAASKTAASDRAAAHAPDAHADPGAGRGVKAAKGGPVRVGSGNFRGDDIRARLEQQLASAGGADGAGAASERRRAGAKKPGEPGGPEEDDGAGDAGDAGGGTPMNLHAQSSERTLEDGKPVEKVTDLWIHHSGGKPAGGGAKSGKGGKAGGGAKAGGAGGGAPAKGGGDQITVFRQTKTIDLDPNSKGDRVKTKLDGARATFVDAPKSGGGAGPTQASGPGT